MSTPASVAVIIPVFNGQTFLGEALESVLRQTLPPKEIIVIDDGSTDGTAELARSFGPRVHVVSRRHEGVGAARNFGASLATANWLAFLDHDDVWEPDNLARQLDQVERSPDADCCYGNWQALRMVEGTNEFRVEPSTPVPSPDELAAVLMERCPLAICSVLIRREVFFAAGGFDTAKPAGEDWKLWLTLSFHGARFVMTPATLAGYRIHRESACHDGLKVLGSRTSVIEECIFPRMSWLQRATTGRRLKSREMAEAAVVMRERETPGWLRMMLRSIAYHPFHSPKRYKIAAHMAVTSGL